MADTGKAVASAKSKTKPVISTAMLPMEGITDVQGADGVYLQRNDVMFTAMKHTQGEFSDFFRALRDEGKVFGQFLETADGKLSETAMLVRVRTTRGTIRPGIYKKGTPVKIAFCDSRHGEMLDVFAVPQSELTPQQLAKSPLFESEIEWGRLSEMEIGEPTDQLQKTLQEVRVHFQKLAGMIPHSPRATANLANWRRKVTVRTGGGTFGLVVNKGKLSVRKEGVKEPDLVAAMQDPSILLAWLRDSTEPVGDSVKSPALTDLVIEGTLVLNKPELETITRLDRVPRSLRRDKVVAVG